MVQLCGILSARLDGTIRRWLVDEAVRWEYRFGRWSLTPSTARLGASSVSFRTRGSATVLSLEKSHSWWHAPGTIGALWDSALAAGWEGAGKPRGMGEGGAYLT
jgi:hypothetical protein